MQTVSDKAVEVLSTPFDNNAEHLQLSESSSIPETIDPSSRKVALSFDNGNIFTFDGEQAGMIANEFATIYNNSPLFQETMHGLASEQDGAYGFHTYVNDIDPNTLGFNFAGTADGLQRSGTFLNVSDLSIHPEQPDIKTVMLHEITHDLHEHDLEHASALQHLNHTGSSHSREQMIYLGAILNEMAHNGESLNYNVNDDYSQNIQFFPSLDLINPWQQSKPIEVLEREAFQLEVVPEDIRAWEQAVISYHQVADNIFNLNEGSDIKAAVNAFLAIPEDQALTMGVTDVDRVVVHEDGSVSPASYATYNVREIILDELVFTYDSNDWLGDNKSRDTVTLEKQAMGAFLNELALQTGDSSHLTELAERLQIDLTTEFPEFIA